MQKIEKNMEFLQGVDFDFIYSLPNNGTKYLLIFDDSCEEISNSKQFVKIATAGRHRGFNTIYIKHNLFHKSKLGRDVELQNTHIALFKSPRDVQQINVLGTQLGLGSQLKEWYKDATSFPFGHLLIDLSPRTVDELRFCTDSGSIPSKFYIPENQTKILDDDYTKSIYASNVPKIFPQEQEKFSSILSKRICSISQRVHNKPSKRGAQRNKTSSYPKIRGRNTTNFYKKNNSEGEKKYPGFKERNTIN